MKKLLSYCAIALMMAGVSGCSDDDDSIVDYVKYDAEYQVKYYDRPSYADLEQGYWFNSEFYKLTPNEKGPYALLVCPKNESGIKALRHISEKEDGVEVHEISSSANGGSFARYFVTSPLYFECPDLYVSDNYFCTNCGMSEGDFCRILPTIVVNLKAEADVKAIEKKYKNVLTLVSANGSRYVFNCNVDNSYEVLRIADEIHRRDDVNWAEADKYSPYHTSEM